MMEIRECRETDFPGISVLIDKFHKEAIEMYGLRCNKETMEKAIRKHYGHAMVLIADGEVVGLMAGHIVDYPLENRKIFQELIWYVSKKYRTHGVRLLRAIEKQCKDKGIQMIIMVAMGSSMKEKLDRIYKIMGYKELETHYIKVME